jgi:FSR family fosmidomycin resistance protein-like MFS transporter
VHRYVPIFCLALIHAVVDAVAMFVEPLWPELRKSYNLSARELFFLLSITQVAPNFSQLVFGYVGDRYGSAYLLWLGPAVAAICLSALGLASTPTTLALLLTVGYIAIGSFHPEGAVSSSRLLPEQRTRGLSVFMVGGTAGLALGPALSGNLVHAFGLKSLAWLAAPVVGLVLAIHLVLQRAARSTAATAPPAHPQHPPHAGSPWKLALLLLAVNSLRVVPNTGMTKALAFALEGRDFESNLIGNMQGLYLACGSLGMIYFGSRLGQGSERWMMIGCPLASIVPLAAMSIPDCPNWLLLALLVPAGVTVIGSSPAIVSYAHQLFPRGAGMASALTMGISWGISGLFVAELTSWLVDRVGRPDLLFVAFTPALALSAFLAATLPRIGSHTPAAAVKPAEEPRY